MAFATPSGAVNLTGSWTLCTDCRVGGVCDPLGPPTFVDQWVITQAASSLVIDSEFFTPVFTGTIDSATGAFTVPNPPNLITFSGVGTFSTIDGMYDALLQSGHITGARRCNPAAPACDDGTACTDDACVTMILGTCTDMTPVPVCINTPNGSCPSTTTTTTTTSTTTTTLPLDHHPVTGSRLVLKRSSKGRQTLSFTSKDPTVYVPAPGAPDDPTLAGMQIDVYSPTGSSSLFAITVPPGTGNPGWKTSVGPTYLFKNGSAPAGISVVRSVKLKAGKGLKIVARASGLPMTTPLGTVGIAVRLTNLSAGTPVICAHFDAASVRKDVPPVFVARASPAPPNCFQTTLSAP